MSIRNEYILKDIIDENFESAEIQLKKTLESENLDPNYVAELHLLLGICYYRQSLFSASLEQFHSALENNPYSVDTYLNICMAYCDLGAYEKAHSTYLELENKLKQASHQSSSIVDYSLAANKLFELANFYFNSKDFEAAESVLHQALKLNRSFQKAELLLARIYFLKQQFEKSLEYSEKLFDTNYQVSTSGMIAACSALKLAQYQTFKNIISRLEVEDHKQGQLYQQFSEHTDGHIPV